MCLLTETRALSAQGEKRALVGNLTMPTEAILACNILNQMTQLGRPASYAIGR